MKIIRLTDIHGKASYFADIEADLVLILGDITHFGDTEDARAILSKLQSFSPSFFAVSGNCDDPGINEYLGGQVKQKQGLQFTGLAGSFTTPFNTLQEYREEEYAVIEVKNGEA